MSETAAIASPDTDAIIMEAIKSLRANPKKYQALKKALARSKTDQARVKVLIKYATSERELAALVPARAKNVSNLAWTTVTITTIFIADSAY